MINQVLEKFKDKFRSALCEIGYKDVEIDRLSRPQIAVIEQVAREVELYVAHEAYNQCLVVECGEGECAEAIRTKFNLENSE